jgi:transcriptional regulator
MYTAKACKERDEAAIRVLMTTRPLATFILNSDDGLIANHIPFVPSGSTLENSELHAHIPRANPLSDVLTVNQPCLTIFQGPQGYISPA